MRWRRGRLNFVRAFIKSRQREKRWDSSFLFAQRSTCNRSSRATLASPAKAEPARKSQTRREQVNPLSSLLNLPALGHTHTHTNRFAIRACWSAAGPPSAPIRSPLFCSPHALLAKSSTEDSLWSCVADFPTQHQRNHKAVRVLVASQLPTSTVTHKPASRVHFHTC